MSREPPPRTLVLLAAYNGRAVLEEQLKTILEQTSVDVHVLISVDRSSDGTEDLVSAIAAEEIRIRHLPHGQVFGGAGPNFYSLMLEADVRGFDYVALSDQDDVWYNDKLATGAAKIRAQSASAYSSNVLTWFPGKTSGRLVNKAQPQRRWDHLFSSAGPGCTYLVTRQSFAAFSDWLRLNHHQALAVEYHDWLVYAWYRQAELAWIIDPHPTMLYRQHANNQLGANAGWRAAKRRLRLMLNGNYARQVLAVAYAVGAEGELPIRLLDSKTILDWGRLIALAPHLRRSKRDLFALPALLFAKRNVRGR